MSEQFKNSKTVITIALDDDDLGAIYQAIGRRLAITDILPDSDSDMAGTVLAEICRAWSDEIDRRQSEYANATEGNPLTFVHLERPTVQE